MEITAKGVGAVKLPKAAALAPAVLLAVGLAGCGRSSIAENFGPALENWRDQGVVPTPVTSAEFSNTQRHDNGDFSDALGFRLTGVPEAAGLTPTAYWSIDWFGQVEYAADAADDDTPWTLVVRVAPDSADQLSSTYSEHHHSLRDPVEIAGVEVQPRPGGEGCILYVWQRGGFQYTLHSNKLQGEVSPDILETLVGGLAAEETA
jgi:hypothetical protein